MSCKGNGGWKDFISIRRESPPGNDYFMGGWKRYLPTDVSPYDKIDVEYSDGYIELNILPSCVCHGQWFDASLYYPKARWVKKYRVIANP